MNHTVNQAPLLHHYLTAILLKTNLAEGTYTHIFNTISDYSVLDYCRCGDPCCSTVTLHSPALIGKDITLATPFTICWIIISFYPNGNMEVENLADHENIHFPFKNEIIDVLTGKPVHYPDDYAKGIIDTFMESLHPLESRLLVV